MPYIEPGQTLSVYGQFPGVGEMPAGLSATINIDGAGAVPTTNTPYAWCLGWYGLDVTYTESNSVVNNMDLSVTTTSGGGVTDTQTFYAHLPLPVEASKRDFVDAIQGAVCGITGAWFPASMLKTLANGKRVWSGLRIEGDRW